MERYLEGWEDRNNVRIPPVEREGFAQNIIIRERAERAVVLQPPRHRAYIRRVGTGETVEIDEDPFVMGKSPKCNFVIGNNITVSRRHAQIMETSEGYMLKDLGSLNHTFLGDIRVEGEEKLADWAQFRLSDENFEFWVERG